MRAETISYMCQLSDRELRMAGTKNTTELMYEAFKDISGFYTLDSSLNGRSFKIDRDGLTLAYKYFTCSTLTIRLCGLAQMNVSLIFLL